MYETETHNAYLGWWPTTQVLEVCSLDRNYGVHVGTHGIGFPRSYLASLDPSTILAIDSSMLEMVTTYLSSLALVHPSCDTPTKPMMVSTNDDGRCHILRFSKQNNNTLKNAHKTLDYELPTLILQKLYNLTARLRLPFSSNHLIIGERPKILSPPPSSVLFQKCYCYFLFLK